MLKAHGYRIRVLNLVEMEQSNGYNPFRYIRSETDIVKLVTNLINNTTPKNAQPSDPFWEKAESLYLQAIFLYVWQECEMEKRNFRMVLQLLNEAEVHADGSPSDLDLSLIHIFAVRLKRMATHISKRFTVWGINGQEAKRNETE